MESYISPWIFTTNKCNLSCPYCYVRQDNKVMAQETYEKINEIFLSMLRNKEVENVIYRLAGGEPTLTFEDWKTPIKFFLKNSNKHGFVSVISNLVYLTEEMITYFVDNKIGFGISLDGFGYSKPFHNGSSSAKIVKNNVDKLLMSGIKSIDISTVVDGKSISDIEALAKWAAERNLNWGIYLDHFFCGEIESEYIFEKIFAAIDVLDNYGYDMFHKFKFNNIKLDKNYEGCTAGKKLITIDVSGNVFPCQTAIYQEPVCNIFDNMNIIDQFKKQNKYQVGYNFSLPEQCKECAIADICGGGCKLNNKEINKNYTCDIMKVILLYVIKKINRGGINA